MPRFPQLTAARRLRFDPLLALLAGCGMAPLDYHPGTEIPRGPGMLTGERGAIVHRLDAGFGRNAPSGCVNAPRDAAPPSTLDCTAAD